MRIVSLTSVNKLQHTVSWKSHNLVWKFLNRISESDDNFVFYLSEKESLEKEFEQGTLNSFDKNTISYNSLKEYSEDYMNTYYLVWKIKYTILMTANNERDPITDYNISIPLLKRLRQDLPQVTRIKRTINVFLEDQLLLDSGLWNTDFFNSETMAYLVE